MPVFEEAGFNQLDAEPPRGSGSTVTSWIDRDADGRLSRIQAIVREPHDMISLHDVTAIVTGAGKGIGAAIAAHLARAGAQVAVDYAQERTSADAVVERFCKDGGKAGALRADVAREDDVQTLFADVRPTYGPVRLLVKNAGVARFLASDAARYVTGEVTFGAGGMQLV